MKDLLDLVNDTLVRLDKRASKTTDWHRSRYLFGANLLRSVILAHNGDDGPLRKVLGDSCQLWLKYDTVCGPQGKKINCIKVVRQMTGMDLKAAKEFVEKAPVMLIDNATPRDVEAWKMAFEESNVDWSGVEIRRT